MLLFDLLQNHYIATCYNGFKLVFHLVSDAFLLTHKQLVLVWWWFFSPRLLFFLFYLRYPVGSYSLAPSSWSMSKHEDYCFQMYSKLTSHKMPIISSWFTIFLPLPMDVISISCNRADILACVIVIPPCFFSCKICYINCTVHTENFTFLEALWKRSLLSLLFGLKQETFIMQVLHRSIRHILAVQCKGYWFRFRRRRQHSAGAI